MIVGHDVAPEHLSSIISEFDLWRPASESDEIATYLSQFLKTLARSGYESELSAFQTFFPPRLIAAAKTGGVVPFFGAGVSVGAGVPTWADLLDRLGVTPDFASDPQLDNDPLTLAELLAHEIGSAELQNELRKIVASRSTPSILHYLLARLSQPVYITTNYDTLFEIAWKRIHGDNEVIVITNDSDFARFKLDPDALAPATNQSILLKLHGCASVTPKS